MLRLFGWLNYKRLAFSASAQLVLCCKKFKKKWSQKFVIINWSLTFATPIDSQGVEFSWNRGSLAQLV